MLFRSLLAGGESKADVWFCGPAGLGQALRQGLQGAGLRFHQEAFQMR